LAKLTLILLGAPGSGKGTLSERLIKKYHIPEISSGEILRKVSHEKGELAREVKKLLDGGNLAPDDLII